MWRLSDDMTTDEKLDWLFLHDQSTPTNCCWSERPS